MEINPTMFLNSPTFDNMVDRKRYIELPTYVKILLGWRANESHDVLIVYIYANLFMLRA